MAHEHAHPPQEQRDLRLWIAVGVNVLLTLGQIVGGVIAGSLSLVADALHNLNDAASIAVALLARRVGRRPADKRNTFGYRRSEMIGALINLVTLIIVGLYLIYEALKRFFEQQPVDGWIVVWIAGLALVVDIVTAILTYAMSKDNLNIRAVFVHNLSDAMASVGVIIAGTLIILYDWNWADLVATLTISAYILWQGTSMLRSTIRILMDGVPEGLDFDQVIKAMTQSHPSVIEVHHLHIRSLDEHRHALEAHVVVGDMSEATESVKSHLRRTLRSRFNIVHSTLEFEPRDSADHDRHVVPQE